MRRTRLVQAQQLQGSLTQAREALKPFLGRVNGEMAASLTLLVEQSATAAGFKARSVNVEKQVGDGAVSTDYRTTVSGEGTFPASVRFLDSLTAPGQPFRVVALSVNVQEFRSEPEYEIDMTLISRSVSAPPEAGGTAGLTTDGIAAILDRARPLTDRVKGWDHRKRLPLDTKPLAKHVWTVASSEPARQAETDVAPVVLRGIIRDREKPLAMTDSGLFGVGDEINGSRIVAIQDDRVTLLHRNGKRETIKLYADEAKP